MTAKICAVLLAGGAGTRLWPASRSQHPKQFSALLGDSSESMLQQTALRLNRFDVASYWTVCNEEHRFIAAEQLREIDKLGTIVLEPEGRNTAPAIALAALAALKEEQDPVLVVMPSDHKISSLEHFEGALRRAINSAQQGYLVTLGVVPNEPATGYGYIQVGELINAGCYSVSAFVEKPDLATARRFIRDQGYYWNSGMFVFKARAYLAELKQYCSEIYDASKAAMDSARTDMSFMRVDREAFLRSPSRSIDHAVMENTKLASLVPLDAGWSDLGSWSAIWNNEEPDSDNNVVTGNVALHDTQGSLVIAQNRLVGLLGVDDTVVIETKDAVLVCHQGRTEDIKTLVQKLDLGGAIETRTHREVMRPWGKYERIDQGDSYQVKKLTVKPGAKLSLQLHHHRAEHWLVVSGTARVIKGNGTFTLEENESTYIPVGEIHSLENVGLRICN